MQTLPILNGQFKSASDYAPKPAAGYRLLPMRFILLDGQRYLLSNFVGEHHVLSGADLADLVRHRLSPAAPLYDDLKSKHFLVDGDSDVALELLAAKYRTKQQLLSEFTRLFLFVVTLRCEHNCPYCQVSRRSADRKAYDLSAEDASRAIDFMFRSPAATIKIEFQGGEPLLNFDRIRQIVAESKARNVRERRQLEFVIATNLACLTDSMLEFCAEHDVQISTSLDGPRALHNDNRPRPGGDSYEKTIEGIARVRHRLGAGKISALMTTTAASLEQPRAIVDEYVRQGFESIFLRAISPYGFAVRAGQTDKYGVQRWLEFYRQALEYIIGLNLAGQTFREEFTSLLLRRILTSFPTGYVDLQSPAGLGIACIAFNFDGAIYASDEGRMLAEMGDCKFRLGHLRQDSYEDVMLSPVLVETLEATMTEGMPMCNDCGFQPYCGSDPVQHYAFQGDVVGFKPSSPFCQKQMAVLRHLFCLLEDDRQAANVLMSWI